MAAVIISSGYYNFDDAFCTGLNSGEACTIDGDGTLYFDSDPQWSLNAAFPGNINVNDGQVIIDGRYIKEVYVTGATTSLPALNSYITGQTSNITGQVCYTGHNRHFRTVSGSLKLRGMTGDFVNGEQLRGDSFTGYASGNSQTGWIYWLGNEAAGFVTQRNGDVIVSGAWYQLGISNGTTGQLFRHYIDEPLPAVWVETGANSNYYDIYLNAGTRWPLLVGSGGKGYFFRMLGTGVTGSQTIQFGKGSGDFPGLIPISGAKIKVPNIHIGSTRPNLWTAAAGFRSSIDNTLATRYDFTTTNAGTITIDKAVGAGLALNSNQAAAINISNFGIFDQINISEVANELNLRSIGIGNYEANDNQALAITTIPATIFASGIYGSTRDLANAELCFNFANCLTGNLYKLKPYALRSNAGGIALQTNACQNLNFYDTDVIGSFVNVTQSQNINFYRTRYSDMPTGGLNTALPISTFTIANTSSNITMSGLSTVDNFSYPPRTALLAATNSSNLKLRGIGSTGAFLNLQQTTYLYSISAQAKNLILDRIYTTGTVTSHHLDTNADTQVYLSNVHGDANDAFSLNSLNSYVRGSRLGSGAFAVGIPITYTAVYGSHFYDVVCSSGVGSGTNGTNVTGKIGIVFNEKTSDSISAASYVASGTTKFNSLGGVIMKNSGDSITYTWPYYIRGWTGFASGFDVTGRNALTNFTYEYALDKGTGVPAFQFINSGIHLETVSPASGVKPYIKITCTGASQLNTLSGLWLRGLSDFNSFYGNPYPLDAVTATLSMTNLQSGSEVRVYNSSTLTELAGTESVVGSTFSYNYLWEGSDTTVDIAVLSLGYQDLRYEAQILGRAGLSLYVAQSVDRVYENN